MKKIILCCDGTWNSADRVEKDGKPCVTNVVKMAVRVARRDDQGVPQIIYYDQGVGTGNYVDKITGGVKGDGLEENIHDAYRFVVANYEQGDEVYLFGFSRGAFTARSISGMIRKCGILTRKRVEKYHEALATYHSDSHPDDAGPKAFRLENSISPTDPIEIKFIGVWDTAGALGIPGGIGHDKHKFEFHDTGLSGSVKYAYHALAIDERRGPFQPTLWDYAPKPDQKVEQVWFCGVHSDIGGGYPESGLSDIALQWMMDKASGAGLKLDKEAIESHQLSPNAQQKLHDSRKRIYNVLPAYDRPVGVPTPGSKNAGPNGLDPTQSVDQSVLDRWDADPKYRPEKLREHFKLKGDPRGLA
jgi:uncharacterized protein (DUF2235 family)